MQKNISFNKDELWDKVFLNNALNGILKNRIWQVQTPTESMLGSCFSMHRTASMILDFLSRNSSLSLNKETIYNMINFTAILNFKNGPLNHLLGGTVGLTDMILNNPKEYFFTQNDYKIEEELLKQNSLESKFVKFIYYLDMYFSCQYNTISYNNFEKEDLINELSKISDINPELQFLCDYIFKGISEDIQEDSEESKFLGLLYFNHGISHKLKITTRFSGHMFSGAPETDTDHCYSMHRIANILLSYDFEGKDELDITKIYEMIYLHDILEAETTDFDSAPKNEEARKAKKEKEKAAFEQFKEILTPYDIKILEEYEARESLEAKFVKMLDTIDPIFLAACEKDVFQDGQWTKEEYMKKNAPHMEAFPEFYYLFEGVSNHIEKNGFFYTGTDN